MNSKTWFRRAFLTSPAVWLRAALVVTALAAPAAVPAAAATFGRVVAIGGNASDLALDEARGVLYIANFTANRVDVVSLATNSLQSSINVPSQPASLAVSPDGKYLVIAHYSPATPPARSANGLTVINLDTRARQTYPMGFTPLALAFGIDGLALIATQSDFELFDPITGTTRVVDTIAGVTAKALPVAAPNIPTQVVAASMAASGDGLKIYGMSDQILLMYDVASQTLRAGAYTSRPLLTPRTVSVNRDGTKWMTGWCLRDAQGHWNSQFLNPAGETDQGSSLIDSVRNLIYAEVSEIANSGGPATPNLQVVDADNLTLKDRLQLAEHLTGKSVLSSDGQTMYSISQSGVTILPVGQLDRVRRLATQQSSLAFRVSLCDRRPITQDLLITDLGGNSTDFSLSTTAAGVSFSPSSGLTPRTVRVTVDPAVFANAKGTSAVTVNVKSTQAVNFPSPVRLLVNAKEPDQRGAFVNVPGKLVDLLADPVRNRFYVLRQDTQEVLVFDGSNYTQTASLKTGTSPMGMALSFDRRSLLVANDQSDYISVFDLETLEQERPIQLRLTSQGFVTYARSIASSGGATLIVARQGTDKSLVMKVDMVSRTASPLPSLGIYDNALPLNSVMTASPNGSSILLVTADGGALLYNATADTFTVARKDFTTLSGPYVASSNDRYVVGNYLLNASLVSQGSMDNGTGTPSGFAFVDDYGLRVSAPDAASPGVLQRVDLSTATGFRASRLVESPLVGKLGVNDNVFTRSLAVLPNRNAMVSLTVSGFTVVPWNYDDAITPPRLSRVVNAADNSAPLAPGGLITIYGNDLSPVAMGSSTTPLPTVLADSCLTVNGLPVPVLYVSPTQINAQMPVQADGNVDLVLRTPGGISDTFRLGLSAGAPGIFRSGVAGDESNLPTVIRVANNQLATLSNPLRRGEIITIFLAGLGRTSPLVEAGQPAPAEPLARTVTTPVLTLGGARLRVDFAGLVPGAIGLYQINAVLPLNTPLGLTVPLVISQGNNATSVDLRVVD